MQHSSSLLVAVLDGVSAAKFSACDAEACYKIFTPTAAINNFDKKIVFYILHSYRGIPNKFSNRVRRCPCLLEKLFGG
jgi:hypothetical protein